LKDQKGKNEQEKNDKTDKKIIIAAEELFKNRLGWATNTPYAPKHFWYKLGVALYGEDDPRVKVMAPSDTKQRVSMRLPNKKKKDKL
jgi:hypothetical protein